MWTKYPSQGGIYRGKMMPCVGAESMRQYSPWPWGNLCCISPPLSCVNVKMQIWVPRASSLHCAFKKMYESGRTVSAICARYPGDAQNCPLNKCSKVVGVVALRTMTEVGIQNYICQNLKHAGLNITPWKFTGRNLDFRILKKKKKPKPSWWIFVCEVINVKIMTSTSFV